jgi:prepilin-type N-terminal cleavage/methylation domain-containing protein
MNAAGRQTGFTLLEVLMVSILSSILMLVLSATWAGLGRPTKDLIQRSLVIHEMRLAAAALTLDLGGSLPGPQGVLGSQAQNRFVGWMQPADSQLWLCFDGGSQPNGVADWAPPDTVIIYQIEGDRLVRWDMSAGTSFTVARYLQSFQVTARDSATIEIDLAFQFRDVQNTYILVARMP